MRDGSIAWLAQAAVSKVMEATRNNAPDDHQKQASADIRANEAARSRVRSALNPSVRAAAAWLSVGLLTIGCVMWLAAVVSRLYLAHTAFANLDPAISSYVEEHRVRWLAHTMWRVTRLGSPWFTLVVVAAGGLAMRVRAHSRRALTLLALAYAGAIILEVALKLAVARPRPLTELMAVITSDSSFPSGHTARATAVYGMLAYVIGELHPAWRHALWITAIVAALLVGISRVYLGMHWTSDVIGGWVVGGAWLSVVIMAKAPRAE